MISRHAYETEVSLFHRFWPFRDREFLNFSHFQSGWSPSSRGRFWNLISLSLVNVEFFLVGLNLIWRYFFLYTNFLEIDLLLQFSFALEEIFTSKANENCGNKDFSCSHSSNSIKFDTFDLCDAGFQCLQTICVLCLPVVYYLSSLDYLMKINSCCNRIAAEQLQSFRLCQQK